MSARLTVGELISVLRHYPVDLPVTVTWECLNIEVDKDRIYKGHYLDCDGSKTLSLVMDVDQYSSWDDVELPEGAVRLHEGKTNG